MLAARGASGAELGADGEGHLDGASGHEAHLGCLVHDLVQADPDEVEVHEFDDGPHAGHGRSHAHAHDSGLGDRGVDEAAGETFVQSPGEAEDVSSGGHVDAGQEDRGVGGQFVFQGGADGAAGLDGGGRCGRLCGDGQRGSGAGVGVDVVAQGLWGRRRGGAGEGDGLLHLAFDLFGDLGEQVAVAVGVDPCGQDGQRVVGLAGGQVLRCAVSLLVAFVVAARAVGLGLDQDGAGA